MWAKPDNCDVTGHDSFYGLQRMMLRRMVTDGEIFTMMVSTGEYLPYRSSLWRPTPWRRGSPARRTFG